MSRPPLDIDEAQVRKLASIQCSMEEIGSVVGCSVDTLERRFADVIEKGRLEGKASLKRTQFVTAMGYSYERRDPKTGERTGEVFSREPNPTMLIWLGKVVLGQREVTLQQMSGPDGRPLEFRDVAGFSDDEIMARATGILSMAEGRRRKAARDVEPPARTNGKRSREA